VGKRGIVYLLDYRVNGYRKIESLGKITKREAELIMAQRQKDIAEGKYPIIKDYKKIYFYEICKEFLQWSRVYKRSFKRDGQFVKHLQSFFGDIPLYRITRKAAEEYQTWRVNQKLRNGKPISKATVNREIACLKRIINKAVEWGKASNNPISRIKMFHEGERKLRFFSEAELEKLIAYAPESLKAIIIVAFLTGMRKGELISLTWKNINFDLGLIYVEHTKSKRVRDIPISDTVRDILWELRKKSNNEYVFVNKKGEPYKNIRIDKLLKKAGIENANFHTLRHTFASNLVMANQNLKVVQELLGHSDLSVTLRYAHLSPNAKTKAIRVLDTEMKPVTSGNKTVTFLDRAEPSKVIP